MTLNFTFTGIQNPMSKLNIDEGITITSKTEEGWHVDRKTSDKINLMFNSYQLHPISDIEIIPEDPTKLVSTSYRIYFTIRNIILKNSDLIIIFPNEVEISTQNLGGIGSLDIC
jgi:hypothetical protein